MAWYAAVGRRRRAKDRVRVGGGLRASAFDVEDDAEPGGINGLTSLFDFSPRSHKVDDRSEWVRKAKKTALAILNGQTSTVS